MAVFEELSAGCKAENKDLLVIILASKDGKWSKHVMSKVPKDLTGEKLRNMIDWKLAVGVLANAVDKDWPKE